MDTPEGSLHVDVLGPLSAKLPMVVASLQPMYLKKRLSIQSFCRCIHVFFEVLKQEPSEVGGAPWAASSGSSKTLGSENLAVTFDLGHPVFV